MISRGQISCERTALLREEERRQRRGGDERIDISASGSIEDDQSEGGDLSRMRKSVLNLSSIVDTLQQWREEGYDIDLHDHERDGPLPCTTTLKELLNTHPLKDYDYFWKILLIICVFYTSPSLQFIFFQASVPEQICYYNFKCKIDMFGIPAFNNVISNTGYVVFGLLFVLIVYKKHNRSETKGLDEHPAFYYSLGLALTFEGIFSALYHVCPSVMNFQFDTTFMVFGGCLTFATLYHKRHAGRAISPAKFYGFMAFVTTFNVIPLNIVPSRIVLVWLWGTVIVVILYLLQLGTSYIYYNSPVTYDTGLPKRVLQRIFNLQKPRDMPRFLFLLLGNTFTIAMAIFGAVTETQYTMWMIGVFMMNMLLYFHFYVFMKLWHGEKVGFRLWFLIVFDFILLVVSLRLFSMIVTDKELSPEESRQLNQDCVVLGWFDYHDLWHFTSALGLFVYLNVVFFLDVDVRDKPRSEIMVF
eukprot:Nk52_evm22s914 gene=Nk52_evmTU22s914